MAKSKDWRRRDQAHAAELKKYEHPVPSRPFLLALLEEQGVPMAAEDIFAELGIRKKRDQEGLANRLAAMARDGQLLRNRRGDYCLVGHLPLVMGRVVAHKDGFGFVVPDEDGDDVYLSPREMREVIHGDRVAVRVRGRDRRGRPDGSLVEVLKRNTTSVVGRYHVESGIAYVEPDNPRITHQVLIPKGAAKRAKRGQIVTAQITEMPTHRTQPVGKVVEVLGTDHAPGMETEIAIRAHGLPHRWPDAVDEEMERFGTR
ncbi:MAG: ribonuclease R, partial [Pseudomonadota bacterium]